MAYRIDVKSIVPDARIKIKQKNLTDLGLAAKAKVIGFFDSYTIDLPLPKNDLGSVAKMLTNPLIETAGTGWELAPKDFDWAVEIGFLPGVADNVGNTVKQEISDFFKTKFKNTQNVYSSYVLFVSGNLSKREIETFAESLYNPLIQRATIKTFAQFQKDKGMGVTVPKVALKGRTQADRVDLDLPGEELRRLGKEGIANLDGTRRGPLALDLAEMRTIRDYFQKIGRNPTDVELESLAQTWSEHCKHTIFNDPLDGIREGIFKHYIRGATEKIRKAKGENDFCVSVFTDNSGAIEFDENYLVTHKMETHNTPSALDPFGGSVTGIVGVNRDTLGFGLSAKPIANLYGFCLAQPSKERSLYRDASKKQKMLSGRRILNGVVAGINAGGNQSGIPTPLGFLYFDDRYRGKPLVFAGTVGLIPKTSAGRPSHIKKAVPGDYIVMIGGRVGLDGIHGATFSSEGLNTSSPVTAVQIGDPITQKKLSDVLIREARDMGLYNSITDNGAGGLSCSIGEMARESGGAEVELDKVPLKYPGLAAWQIWISESQERMTLSVPPKKWKKFSDLMQKRGVEATVIGKFTDTGRCVVKYGRKTVMDLNLQFLHNGRPKRLLRSREAQNVKRKMQKNFSGNLNQDILNMLSQPNFASTEFVAKQYDHEVQGSSVTKPLIGRGRVNADAAVLRPVLPSSKGIVLSFGLGSSYSERDPYNMAAIAIDSAIRANLAAGGNLGHMAILDNFCWSSGDSPERLWQLKQAVKACHDVAVAYGTPFISGKDSMFNDFQGFDENGKPTKISIPPTLLISAISVVNDVSKAVTPDIKFAGDLIYLLGENSPFAPSLSNRGAGGVPKVNAKKNLKLYRALQNCFQNNLVASAISIHAGGLAYAFARMAMAGGLGIKISLDAKLPPEVALFSESQGRFVVSVNPKKAEKFEKALAGNAFTQIGKVSRDKTIVVTDQDGRKIINLPLSRALTAYRTTFKNY